MIGPLLAGLAAVGAGLTVSWKVAVAAAVVVYGFRVVQDYVINPRLFGRAVHLPPLVVLIAVSALALLLGAGVGSACDPAHGRDLDIARCSRLEAGSRRTSRFRACSCPRKRRCGYGGVGGTDDGSRRR